MSWALVSPSSHALAMANVTYYTGYYTYGLATVLKQWKNASGRTHLIVHRGDERALDDVVELMYRWYDGGESSIVNGSIWHES